MAEWLRHILKSRDAVAVDPDDLPDDIADALESAGVIERRTAWYAHVAPTFKVYIKLNKAKDQAKFLVVACNRSTATDHLWAPPT
jgi:hypothetical protein